MQLIDFLNETQSGKSKHFALMKDALDQISLKPEKGRRKDLKKIEDTVRSMRKIAFDKSS